MKYDFELDLETRNSLSCIVQRMKPYSRVLEFGCANGRLTKYLNTALHCEIDIVEIDEDAGKCAAQYAQHALIGDKEGDAESFLWHEKLKRNDYDYIVFADILEHLHRPKAVLCAAKQHLKAKGSILVSIPNIANNNIIANLLRNEFVYTDTGLLDNTHITFFTKHSFEQLIREIGCHLAYETATYTNIGNTEVPIQYADIPDDTKKVLMNHAFGDVYQYIFEIKTEETIPVMDVEPYHEKYYLSTLYYKYKDEDFHASDMVRFHSGLHENKYTNHLKFAKAVDLLRLDFIETTGMIMIHSITVNGSEYPISSLQSNAVWVNDRLMIFATKDPNIFLPLDAVTDVEITISYEIIDTDLQENLIETVSLLQEQQKALQWQYDVLKKQYENDEMRLQIIHDRLKGFWRWLDKGNSRFQNNRIDYYIDAVNISLRHVHIRGWCISENQQPINIKGRPLLNIKRYVREDVNKTKKMEKGYLSGFDVFASPMLPLRLRFACMMDQNQYQLNVPRLYASYWKQLLVRMKRSLRTRGFTGSAKLFVHKLLHRGEPYPDSYEDWFLKHRVTADELTRQRKHKFAYEPLISIVVPTYNTPSKYLDEMIQSVMNQSYGNWELCIADGHSTQKETLAMLAKYEKNEKIHVNYLKENYMISGNTNEAIKMANGEFIALMDHDDVIEADTLYEFISLLNENKALDFIYSDEDKINQDGSHYMIPHFKPDFSMENLRNYNYITHFALIRKTILDEIGLLDRECDGAQDYDLFLRICDKTHNIGHVAKILYHWRINENSTAQSISTKSYVMEAGKRALRKHLERVGLEGDVVDGLEPTLYKVNYKILGEPLISIVICTKDHIDDLDNCIQSILTKSTYQNYEIVIVENNSVEPRTFAYYDRLKANEKIRVVYWEHEFNYSAINNYGVHCANGEYVLLLNNDTEVITDRWLEELLMYAQRADVGAVGAKLLYPDHTIQHAGIIVGLGGVAAHSHRGFPADSVGYVGRLIVTQNISAVTGACLMIRKEKYLQVGGLSEKYKVTYNDVDFCLRVMAAGYHNIMNPFVQLYHYESKSRGMEDTPEKHERFMAEQRMFRQDWQDILERGDPYYNKNLTLSREDFSLRT